MIEIWTFDYDPHTGSPEPIATTCEEFGYPNRDVEGRTQYENTHFLTKNKAWRGLRANAKANEASWAQERAQLRRRLEDVTNKLADAAEFAVNVEAAFKREQEAASLDAAKP